MYQYFFHKSYKLALTHEEAVTGKEAHVHQLLLFQMNHKLKLYLFSNIFEIICFLTMHKQESLIWFWELLQKHKQAGAVGGSPFWFLSAAVKEGIVGIFVNLFCI